MIQHTRLINVNIEDAEEIPTPREIKKDLPAPRHLLDFVLKSRKTIQNILLGKDPRKLLVIGPCSIHDPKSALEYAKKLAQLKKDVEDCFFIIMRVYFEKPRTTVGWKGLINDPYLDDSFHIEQGLRLSRQLLLDMNSLGVPCGTEALDPITPQYLSELISWAAIGARTTESQTHREMTSGLSMPVGIKNGTDGNVQIAIDALKAVKSPHHFLGISQSGKICKFRTKGNNFGHIVLRGGGGKPNYQSKHIQACQELLRKHSLLDKVLIDCSHANSNKDYKNQPLVFQNGISQIIKGNQSILGFMLESHLHAGQQNITDNKKKLAYGVSITDACIDWNTTREIILNAREHIKQMISG